MASAALLALALAAAGCGGGEPAKAESFVDGGTFNIQITTDPGNLDPLGAADNTTMLLAGFAYDTLINLDEKGEPVPQLAEKWQISPTTATFTLRKDVTCGDGTKLTATQVAANFTYVKNPDNQSPIIGSRLPNSDFTVTADDTASTVTVTLAKPHGFLLAGAGLIPIVCAKGTADRKSLEHGTDGTGPYRLVESVASDHYTFEVRKDYRWGPNGAGTQAAGVPAKVVFKVVQSESTAVNLLLSGQLNALSVSGVDRKRLQNKGFHEVSDPGLPQLLFFNQRPGHPGADPAVRKALTTGLDLGKLVKVMTQDNGSAPANLQSNQPKPCRIDTVPGSLPAHDKAAAGAALDAAGWAAGSGGVRAKDGKKLSLRLQYPSGESSLDAGMELLSQMWKELGVEVAVKPQDANALSETLFGNPGAWDAAVLGIGVSFPSQLVGFLSGPAVPDGQNFAALNNPDYTRLAGQAGGTPGAAGCELWAQAEKTLFQRQDVVPLSVSIVHTFGNKARFASGWAGYEPTSLRLLAD